LKAAAGDGNSYRSDPFEAVTAAIAKAPKPMQCKKDRDPAAVTYQAITAQIPDARQGESRRRD